MASLIDEANELAKESQVVASEVHAQVLGFAQELDHLQIASQESKFFEAGLACVTQTSNPVSIYVFTSYCGSVRLLGLLKACWDLSKAVEAAQSMLCPHTLYCIAGCKLQVVDSSPPSMAVSGATKEH